MIVDGRGDDAGDRRAVNLTVAAARVGGDEIARQSHNLKPTGQHGRRQWLGDPLEVALVELAEEIIPGAVERPRLDEVPFDSKRRRMSTLHEGAEGKVLFTKGAPEAVLPLCDRLELSDGPAALDGEWRTSLITAQQAMAHEGLRVLALAYRPLVAAEVTRLTSAVAQPSTFNAISPAVS